ncbi:MAG TPA: DUF6263 family protein [Chitinophagaceae bacterium]|jgi:CYTH domain-containing protein|nr:DUF6263 family protein [Chitinophagaceae bacterium]HMU57987.1 DUF6263 family protein [Chitinophagaceae bacterium]
MQKIVLVLLAGFMLPLFSGAQTAADVKPAAANAGIQVKAGQKFRVKSTIKLTSAAETMGQTMETNADSKNVVVYEVINAGNAEIEMQKTMTKLSVNTSMMGQEMNYDSDKDDNPDMMKEMFQNIINKAEGITIDYKGTIIKQDESASSSNPVMAMSGVSTNASATELFIPELAGKELKVGDSISSVSVTKVDKYSSKDSGTYKVHLVDNGIASVSYSGTQQVTTVMEQMGMEMNSASSNVVKAELQLDTKTGLVLAKATVIDTNTTIEVMGMQIPSTGKVISTITVETE